MHAFGVLEVALFPPQGQIAGTYELPSAQHAFESPVLSGPEMPWVVLPLAQRRSILVNFSAAAIAGERCITLDARFPPSAEQGKRLVSSKHQQQQFNGGDDFASQGQQTRYDIQAELVRNVGGLAPELEELARSVLSLRRLNSTMRAALGVSPVKGALLYGPPGTGKTLIARELSRVLSVREPKIVNGPGALISTYIHSFRSFLCANQHCLSPKFHI